MEKSMTQTILPIDQMEHLVPKVYLKQWAKNDFLTVLDFDGRSILNIEPKDYTTKLNHYDIKWSDSGLAKHNELELGRLENEYDSFLNILKNQGGINDSKWQWYCNRFVALTYVRSISNWNMFNDILKGESTRKAFLKEVYSDNALPFDSGLIVKIFEMTEPMNLFLCDIASYFQMRLMEFNQIILKTAPNETPFITSTNPVIKFDNIGFRSPFFELSSEIFLSLSPEYCLFLYHPQFCPNHNELHDLPNRKVSRISKSFSWDFSTKISLASGAKEFIMPFDLGSDVFELISKNALDELDSTNGGFFKWESDL